MSFTKFCSEVWYNFLNVVLNNYVNFNGRAGRKEYWEFVLFNIAVTAVLDILGSIALSGFFTAVAGLYSLATLLPNLSLVWRRLHDTGKSGLYCLLALIPIVGWIIVIIRLAKAGDAGTNAYGPCPYAD